MSIEKDIRIIDLLAQREAEFMKVHALEEAVRSLLGGAAFPFPEVPVDLPSRHPRKQKLPSQAQTEKMTVPGNAVCGLRKLHAPEENCYHVFYIDENGQHQESFQNSFELLEEVLQLQSDEFRVTGIETVFFQSMEQWRGIEWIFETDEVEK